METAFSTLGFVIFGLWISIYVIAVESHRLNAVSKLPSFSHPPPGLRPYSPPPKSRPSPYRQPSVGSSPKGRKNGNPLHSPHPHPPPSSPPPPSAPPPILASHRTPSLRSQEPTHQSHQKNKGKVLGLLFLGMAAIMQIVVVGFLVFKRRQLLMTKDRYETGS